MKSRAAGRDTFIQAEMGLQKESMGCMYRVAAIFPEQFQCFTLALKNNLFYKFFPQNRLSSLPKHNYKVTNSHIPAKMNQQEESPDYAPDIP
jgi:hypothetical protein